MVVLINCPEPSNQTKPLRGYPNGCIGLIPTGGHNPPIQILGEIILEIQHQNKGIKNHSSAKINHKNPINRFLSTIPARFPNICSIIRSLAQPTIPHNPKSVPSINKKPVYQYLFRKKAQPQAQIARPQAAQNGHGVQSYFGNDDLCI
jgi:hypothetical protein